MKQISNIEKLFTALEKNSHGNWEAQKRWLINNVNKYCPSVDKLSFRKALIIFDEICEWADGETKDFNPIFVYQWHTIWNIYTVISTGKKINPMIIF